MSSSRSKPLTATFLAQSRVSEYLWSCIAPAAVATVFILARIYTRAVLLRVWGLDDTLITISWIGSVALSVLDCLIVRYGAGRNIQTLSADDIVPSKVLSYAVRLFYQLVLSTTKLGICGFYLRVFTDPRSKVLVYVLAFFITLLTIPLLLIQVLQCNPISDAWALSDPHCPVSEITVINVTGVFNIFSDVLLLAFVIPRILALQMPFRQKMALSAILTTSLLVIVAAIIRTRLVSELSASTDPSWGNVLVALWSVIEVNTGIFCASIAALKPLLRQVFPGLLSTHGQSTNAYDRSTNTAFCTGSKLCAHRNGPRAFELHSIHNDEGNSFRAQPTTTNEFWAGRADRNPGDGESERHVLGDQQGKIAISKTVDVTVTENRDKFLDRDQSSDSSIRRFEHL